MYPGADHDVEKFSGSLSITNTKTFQKKGLFVPAIRHDFYKIFMFP